MAMANLEIYIKEVTAQTLNRVIKWQYMDPLAVFDIMACLDVTEITKLDTDIITSN
jgi:hypothetical protein